MQYFQKLIQKDHGFTHTLGEPIPSFDRAQVWTLHHGTAKDNGEPSLVFHYDPTKSANASRNQSLAKTGLTRLKTLRHPDVLKYVTSVEASDGTIYVATEPATPLATILSNSPSALDRETVQWGLFTISRALGFMHSSGLIHGRLNASAVFVTPTGDWKLGGLECVTPHASAASLAQHATGLQPAPYQSPEFSHGNWSSVAAAAPPAVDSWALGCLMYEAHAGSLTTPDNLQNIAALPKPLHSAYQKLLASNPAARAPAGQLPNHPYFQGSKFVELNMFVENLALKGQLEREAFLSKLTSIMDRLPDGFCTFKVLPMLSQSIDTGTGGSAAFACIVKMKDRLSASDFSKHVVNKYALSWFNNQNMDRNLRVELYANLELFTTHFDDNAINSTVFPAICNAFQEMQAPALRDASVKSVLTIVDRLTDKNLNNVLMSHFARLQVDPEPAIRTNTTVCLGKIAIKLSEAARTKVLAAAFIRSLKDPFPPARAAGVNAILITSDYYSVKDMATRLLPATVPLMVDGSGEVRKLAFRVTSDFQKRLTSNHEKMCRVEATSAASAPKAEQMGTATGAASAANTASGGWGLSTFTSMTAALLSKSESTSSNLGGSGGSSTGISSEDFRNGKATTSVSSASFSNANGAGNKAAPEPSMAARPTAPSTDVWGDLNGSSNTTSAPKPLAVGGGSSMGLMDFGTDDAVTVEDDDDLDGWGDMDVSASTEKDEDDALSAILGKPPPSRVRPSGGGTVGSSLSGLGGGVAPRRAAVSVAAPAAKTGGDLWDLGPTQVSRPKPRSGAAGRRGKSGGEDWEALLGGTSTGTRRKAGRG